MNLAAARPTPENTASPKKAYLLTCYMTGSVHGKNLGTPGYSYDFVAQLFARLLGERGKVVPVPEPKFNLEQAASDARKEGFEPIHISFLPFQDVVMCKSAPNVIVPAWEFPDVPNQEFDGNPRNNWVTMANASELVLVGGQFTVDSMRRGGVTSAVEIVPVPTPEGYFQRGSWALGKKSTVPCRAYWPKSDAKVDVEDTPTRSACLKGARKSLSQALKQFYMAALGPKTYQAISDSMKSRRAERRRKRASQRTEPDVLTLNYPSTSELNLSGIVYTSIFNPDDGRKNWQDLLNAFLIGLGDKSDATLVMKLITRRKDAVEHVIRYYLEREIPHQCKVAIVVDYLSDETLFQLCEASTYYYQATKAEGNCLPLMNYLAAGRPGISPDHSAIGDYFDDSIGFVIDSDQEPAAWPHDSKLRIRTTWGRLRWTSCRDQLRESYRLATEEPKAYQAMSRRCRDKMLNWASFEAVAAKLDEALARLENRTATNDQPVILRLQDHFPIVTKSKRKAA